MKTSHGKEELQKMSKMSPLPKSEERKGGKKITDPPVYKPTVQFTCVHDMWYIMATKCTKRNFICMKKTYPNMFIMTT